MYIWLKCFLIQKEPRKSFGPVHFGKGAHSALELTLELTSAATRWWHMDVYTFFLQGSNVSTYEFVEVTWGNSEVAFRWLLILDLAVYAR